MALNRNWRILILGLVLSTLALIVAPAYAQTNLLVNPSFEGGQDGDGSPTGWSPWSITQDGGTDSESCKLWVPPVYGVTGRAQAGSSAVLYDTNNAAHNAGLLQVVSGVTPGVTYRFTIYAFSQSRAEDSTDDSATRLWVGIDPTGGTDATSTGITWSNIYDYRDSYGQLAVEATAQQSTITVFLRSLPIWCSERNRAVWDNASLTALNAPAQATEVPQATSTAAPASSQLATPDASGRIVHTVQAGDTLSSLAFRYGVTVNQIRELNNMSSDTVVLGTNLVIKAGEGAATEEPPEEPTEEATEEVTEEPTSEEETTGEDSDEEVAEVEEPTEEETTAEVGSVCVNSYNDTNGNGVHEPGEPKLAGVTFAVNDGSETVDTHTTVAEGDFHCFDGLPVGTYVVSWTGEDLTPTTEQQWTTQVTAGSIQTREFGAQPADEAALDDADTSLSDGDGLPTWLLALLGALAVFIVLGGLGAIGYFFLVRRQKI